MNESLIIRYGDLCLKGGNKKQFIKLADSLIREKLEGLDCVYKSYGERGYLTIGNEKLDDVIKALDRVSGLYSYSLFTKCDHDINEIKELALGAYDKYHKEGESFKIDCRRAYKNVPYDTYDVLSEVSAYILKNRTGCKVDVHNPDLDIYIEIRDDGAYVLTDSIKAMGGYPTGSGGKAILMMSGGIDSPVAAYELIKQGMTVELIHFESTPLTSIESAQKVIDLAKKIALYARGNRIMVHFVPFTKVHQEILDKVNEDYLITIMRRCMYKIATRMAHYRKALAIGNGESLGQVASQTIESMYVINEVTNMPVLRPLLTIDKKEIIKIAEKIDTYDISIRPFEDCCTVYVPSHPVIKPSLKEAIEEENKGNFEELINEACKNTIRINISKDSNIDLASLGFTVNEALNNYLKDIKGE